jgi:hypothetical protein
MATYTITKRNGELLEFATDLSVRQAADLIDAKVNPSEFEISLLSAFKRGRISPAQKLWLLKLAADATQPPVVGPYQPLVDRINQMQSFAKGRVQLRLEDVTVKAVSKGPNIGSVYVYSPSGEYWGKITPTGELRTGADVSVFADCLAEATADPVAAAVRYGRLTGNCACCGRPLTDPKSVELGIGPICLVKLK